MKSVMEGNQDKPVVADDNAARQMVPSDESLKEAWPKLAAAYSDKPRLASMLSSTALSIEEKEDGKWVTFRVVNQAQKDWVESKLLHELEGKYRNILGSAKVFLRVSIVPDDPQEPKTAYMPGEQAKELISQNEQVKNLVQDLALDVK